jgi:hypothetical protein
VTIICQACGRRHRLERTVGRAESIAIVCHHCELTLEAVLDAAELRRVRCGRAHTAPRQATKGLTPHRTS